MNNEKQALIEKMVKLKQIENNTVDLEAYAMGLSEMYDSIIVLQSKQKPEPKL